MSSNNQTQLAREEYSLDQLRAMVNTSFLPAHASDYYGAVKQLFAVLTERRALNGSEHKAITLREYRADLLRQVREAVESVPTIVAKGYMMTPQAVGVTSYKAGVLAAIDKLAETNQPERER